MSKPGTVDIRIEYFYDPESKGWSFRVPGLNIIGGADTRQEAEQQAIEAVLFTLEDEGEPASGPNVEVSVLRVSVTSPRVVPSPTP